MRISLSVLLVSSLSLGACGGIGDAALSPANWFGRASPEAVSGPGTPVNPLIPETREGLLSRLRSEDEYNGQPIGEITDLTVEQVPGGAIIRATGLAARQGVYAVQLTPATAENIAVDGVLGYRLEGITPETAAAGPSATREVTAAVKLTNQELAGVRMIRVEGLSNARVSRR